MKDKGKCGVPGCFGPNDILGVCASCHRRFQDGDKSIEPYICRESKPAAPHAPSPQLKGICLVAGCDRPVKMRGVCAVCAQYVRKYPDTPRGRMIAKVLLPARRGRRAQDKTLVGIALATARKGEACPGLLSPVKEPVPVNRSFGETVDYLVEILRPLDQHRRACVVNAAAAFLKIDLQVEFPNA